MTKFVFDPRQVVRYRFPTHTNDLIMDRQEATTSEAFFVVIEPGESAPMHTHPDAEQLFYILEGEGLLTTVDQVEETHKLAPGNFVRTPPGIPHSVLCVGRNRLVYLSIDCFVAALDAGERTWDEHVAAVCARSGLSFDSVRVGPIEIDGYPRPASNPDPS